MLAVFPAYIGETCCHFKTRIEEHIKKDNKYHIFKHLHSTATCFDSYNSLCFKIIDKSKSKFDLKIKEASHINWRKPFCDSLTKLRSYNLRESLINSFEVPKSWKTKITN